MEKEEGWRRRPALELTQSRYNDSLAPWNDAEERPDLVVHNVLIVP